MERVIILVALLLGTLSQVEVINNLDPAYFVLPYFLATIALAVFYLVRNKKSIYTILFALSLLAQIGAIWKLLHLDYAALMMSIGQIVSTILIIYFVVRPILEKEKMDLNFYVIAGISVLVVAQWIDIVSNPDDVNISMYLNIAILMLIGILKVFGRPKNQMNKFEFDILTYNFVVLFIGMLNYLN